MEPVSEMYNYNYNIAPQQGLIQTPEEHKIKEARRHKIYSRIHKEEIAIQKKQYYEDNQEKLAEYHKVNGRIKIPCPNCGATIAKHCMSVHRKTKTCQSFITE